MNSRISSNEDIFKYELVSSDPVITSLRIITAKDKKDLTLNAEKFLIKN